jgi:UDP-N-acetylmuramate--alanine ligase
LLNKKGLDLKGDPQWTYGLSDGPSSPLGAEGLPKAPDFFASDITIDQGDYLFNVQTGDWQLKNVVLTMGGRHNVENATAAIAVAHRLGIAGDKVIAAVAAFRGVRRRFEYIVKKPGRVYIDDYAHHPEELRALISGARELFGGMKCTIIFQPHLFSRTRDFVDGFAKSLDLADEVFLLPIYPARELPMEGVTSQLIAERMTPGKATVVDKKEVLDIIKDMVDYGDDLKLLITAGAGDIDTLVQPIRQLLK